MNAAGEREGEIAVVAINKFDRRYSRVACINIISNDFYGVVMYFLSPFRITCDHFGKIAFWDLSLNFAKFKDMAAVLRLV